MTHGKCLLQELSHILLVAYFSPNGHTADLLTYFFRLGEVGHKKGESDKLVNGVSKITIFNRSKL